MLADKNRQQTKPMPSARNSSYSTYGLALDEFGEYKLMYENRGEMDRDPLLFHGEWKPPFKTSKRGVYDPNLKGSVDWSMLCEEARTYEEKLVVFGISDSLTIIEFEELYNKLDNLIFEYIQSKKVFSVE